MSNSNQTAASSISPMTEVLTAENDAHPVIYELTPDDLAAAVRYHGANDVVDALLTVAEEAYGDEAVVKVHALLLARATRVTPPGEPRP